MTSTDVETELALLRSRRWWVYLVTGGGWLVFGWIVLTARSEITTVWAVAVYAGVLFFLIGVGQLVTAFVAEGWRWLHGVSGVIAIVAGIFAFVWPGQTFVTLAAILAWYLLFDGTFQIVAAFMARHDVDYWWMFLVIGIVEVLIAFWAIGYPGRSIVLLVVWVGATALAKGMSQIIGTFMLRSLPRHVRPAGT